MKKSKTLLLGIDVGSTTAKCVVVDPQSRAILWRRYERHETRQAEKIAELLTAVAADFPDRSTADFHAFITGSGAGPITEPIGARFIQEVNAVTLAVEYLHPEVNSVIELGGQDAKIILFKENPKTGGRQVITSMNDKCASGTGATIDKCVFKVGMSFAQLSTCHFDAGKLHHVAAKCGVFAETDIINLIKAGVPAAEVMNSLIDAIVMQNLSVLTRGNTLYPGVLLLGGPNTYLPLLQECWQLRIPETWEERGFSPPEQAPEELIRVPDNAQYYAAFGAVVFGIQETETRPVYRGLEALQEFIRHGRKAALGNNVAPPLINGHEQLQAFQQQYQVPTFSPAVFEPNNHIRGYIGLDGGSTSSKAVLIDQHGQILAKEYQLSQGNPIQDTKELLARIKQFATKQHCTLDILGFGTTGYAADVLETAIRSDANIVETVAHMTSAKRYCGDDVDVICDIGGQDIKVLFMQNGTIKNFRLSNQCSAGNGMLLQAMAAQFGTDVRDYARIAFQAELSPKFSYGCAVFLDTDRVNFQKEGFTREELFAGLAMVLPKNIWQYVVQIPRIGELGSKFVLQGGTQYNLAAVKAQVDYIQERVPDAEIVVHPHCGEAGAIGAALEAMRLVKRRGHSTFIGLDEAINLVYTTRTDESTRCTFCDNHCSRTFIDTRRPDGGSSRYIAGFSCEKGTVESKAAVIALNKERKRLKTLYPNLVGYEADLPFRHFYQPEPMPVAGTLIDDEIVRRRWFRAGSIKRTPVRRPFQASTQQAWLQRQKIRIGIPRALNNYMVAPFLRTYLETLGIEPRNIVFSDHTSEEMWLEGGKYGSIDPCYPAKVSLAHVHHLIHHKHARKPLAYIWFPCITHMHSYITYTQGLTTCPIVAGTPKVVEAAFTKEKDFFARAKVQYLSDALNFELPDLLRQQLFNLWGERLDITQDENDWACEQGLEAMRLCDEELQQRGLEILTRAEEENDIVLLLLGRPYHNDPGLNHEILDEFQSLGYPVLSIRSLPKDPAYLKRLFSDDIRAGKIENVFDIRDVWPENYSINSAQKVWAAKFAARHPNIAVLDLSSFKCGHDAPTYGLIEKILATSKTPYMAMHDIDANKPSGSIKIRVKTYAYSLDLYKEHLADVAARRTQLEQAVSEKRHQLVRVHMAALKHGRCCQDSPKWGLLNDAYQEYLEGDQEQKSLLDDELEHDNSVPVRFYKNLHALCDEPATSRARAECEMVQEPDMDTVDKKVHGTE
jgi:activator of 2-hydroxyglutaryl-CoA dehydratase/predicted nucleotide-binding protein (sugar kinase/HSP70/actin superfamily)